jgi:hypothetical protein
VVIVTYVLLDIMPNQPCLHHSFPISGKKLLVILAGLAIGIAAYVAMLMINGDKTGSVSHAPDSITNRVSTQSAVAPGNDTAGSSEKDAPEEIKPEDPFEKEFNENSDMADNTLNEKDSGKDLPPFFPLTDELKELIRRAEYALRMDVSDEEKLAAVKELEGINNPGVLNAVHAALREGNVDVREAALDAIMDINDAVVIPAVIMALDDEEPELREYAMDALMDIDDPALNEVFAKALDDENLDVREAAADMMLFIESPNIINSLGKAMLDPNEDIRDMALMTIEDIPDKRSVDILIQHGLLNDNETIREDALDSIEWITDMEFNNYEDARAWWDVNRSDFTFDN